jgi:hypothetical protein
MSAKPTPTFDVAGLFILIGGDVKFYVTRDDDDIVYASLDRLVDDLDPNADYTDYCERDYSLWEDNVVAPLLRKHGFNIGKFFTVEGDSFGPQVRGVKVFFDDQTVVFYYG